MISPHTRSIKNTDSPLLQKGVRRTRKTVNLENKISEIHNTLVLPTFLYGSENWTLTALQRRRIEAAEMKLLRPLAGYTLYLHTQRTTDYRHTRQDR